MEEVYEEFIRPFVHLKDLSFEPESVYAYGKMTIPSTLKTPNYYAIALWFYEGKEPLTVTYETEEERDSELDIVVKYVTGRYR